MMLYYNLFEAFALFTSGMLIACAMGVLMAHSRDIFNFLPHRVFVAWVLMVLMPVVSMAIMTKGFGLWM